MGVIAALKRNNVGAVIVSVFDWYRESLQVTYNRVLFLTAYSFTLPGRREEATSQTRPRHPRLWLS